jgi:hypothetical protein
MVDVPQFELHGDPCKEPGCKGVLIDSLSLPGHDFFRKCSECGHETGRVPAADKLAEFDAIIQRIVEENP